MFQERVFPNQYYLLRDIEYINAIPHDRIPVPVPVVLDPPTITSRRDARNYLLYRLFLVPQNQIKHKLFKYIYPKAFDTNKDINSYNIEISARPLAVQDNDKQKLRYWKFKQLLMWTQLEDLQVKIEEVTNINNLFPTFKIDFYNVKYMIIRK